MVNKGFPQFGVTQEGTDITALKNYNLPDFVLRLVAKQCGSDLLEKGRIDDKLQSMNESALGMLHRVFVDCEFDDEGRFATYRFYAYVSSTYHRCEILLDEPIPGRSGKNHRVPVAVKSSGVYVAIAFNKSTGRPVTKGDMTRMHRIAYDIKRGGHGTQLGEATYCSSVGFRDNAIPEIGIVTKAYGKVPEGAIVFKAANFDNNIFDTTIC